MAIVKEEWIRIELTSLSDDAKKELGEWISKNKPARRLVKKLVFETKNGTRYYSVQWIRKEVDL